MKKILVALLVFIMAFGMFGCGGSGETEDDGATIGLIVSTLNNPFFVDLRDGAQAKADELGATLVVLDSQDDSAIELSNMEDLITQGVDVILINPTASEAVGSAVALANEAGIPVITLDRAANSGDVVCHIASDNVAGGKLAGEFIIEKLGGAGKVVELEGVPGASAAIERGEGFNAAAEGKLEVVARQTANFNRDEGMSVMENILQAQPEIDAVFAHNDEMALGAVSALQTAGYNKDGAKVIPVFGVDATDAAKDAIAKGSMIGTIKQDAEGMAKAITSITQNFFGEKEKFEGIETENVVGTWRVNIPYGVYTGE